MGAYARIGKTLKTPIHCIGPCTLFLARAYTLYSPYSPFIYIYKKIKKEG